MRQFCKSLVFTLALFVAVAASSTPDTAQADHHEKMEMEKAMIKKSQMDMKKDMMKAKEDMKKKKMKMKEDMMQMKKETQSR